MTPPRDPWSVAAEREAARISARVEKRPRELERRPQGAAGNSASFTRAANRLCDLRPVRVGLTLALKRGKRAYVTTVNGIPVAYTREGWFTQEQVDAKIASPAATRIGNPASHAQAAGGAGRSPGGSGSAVEGGSSAVGGAGDSTAAQKGEVNAGRKPSARFRSITGRGEAAGGGPGKPRGDGERVP